MEWRGVRERVAIFIFFLFSFVFVAECIGLKLNSKSYLGGFEGVSGVSGDAIVTPGVWGASRGIHSEIVINDFYIILFFFLY